MGPQTGLKSKHGGICQIEDYFVRHQVPLTYIWQTYAYPYRMSRMFFQVAACLVPVTEEAELYQDEYVTRNTGLC